MGERIGMDIADMMWDRVTRIIENNAADYRGCSERFLKTFAMECPFRSSEL